MQSVSSAEDVGIGKHTFAMKFPGRRYCVDETMSGTAWPSTGTIAEGFDHSTVPNVHES